MRTFLSLLALTSLLLACDDDVDLAREGTGGSSGTGVAAGTGGTGGAAGGQSGAAGTGGQSGTAGLGGQSGTAGIAGQSGTAGSGGESGQNAGGDSGAAGTAGSAGAAGQANLCDPGAACFSCCSYVGPTPDSSCKATSCEVDCGLPSPCESLNLYVPGTPDPAIVACVMGVLRDGTSARVIWSGPGSVPGGDEGAIIYVLAGRKAVESYSQGFDLAGNKVTVGGPKTLKPPVFFEACAQKTDQQELVDCLRQATDACVATGD